MGKPKTCGTCGKPVRGHDGPPGAKCQFSFTLGTPSKDTNEPVVSELLAQMGKLAAAVELLSLEQKNIKTTLQGSSNSQDIPPIDSVSSLDDASQHLPGEINPTTNHPIDTVTLTTGARISARTARAARAGEFINLQEFIPCTDPSTDFETTIENNQLICRPKKSKRRLENFYIWSQAWAGLESLLVQTNPSLYHTLSKYRLFIQEQDQRFRWGHVFSYDSRHRAQLAITRSFNFTQTNMEIFVSTCAATDPKKTADNACHRCHDLQHHVKDCPFTAGPQVEKAQSTASAGSHYGQPRGQFNQRRGPQPQRAYTTPPVCIKFNAGECSLPCPRRHVCIKCGGNEPKPRCLSCTPPPTFNQFSPQSGSLGAAATFSPR